VYCPVCGVAESNVEDIYGLVKLFTQVVCLSLKSSSRYGCGFPHIQAYVRRFLIEVYRLP